MLSPEAPISLPFAFEPFFSTPSPWENPSSQAITTIHNIIIIPPPPPSPLPRQDNNGKLPGRAELDEDLEERRRLRRKISNRESARRSRKRKQEHIDELQAQIDRYKLDNRALSDRLGVLNHSCMLFRGHNDRLKLECASLRLRLHDLKSVLLLRKLQGMSTGGGLYAVGNGQTLIT